MNNTDTICAYPWTWFSFNVDYGMWRACPRSEYRWFQTESEVDNFFNTKTEQKIRSDLYNGTRNSNCDVGSYLSYSICFSIKLFKKTQHIFFKVIPS